MGKLKADEMFPQDIYTGEEKQEYLKEEVKPSRNITNRHLQVNEYFKRNARLVRIGIFLKIVFTVFLLCVGIFTKSLGLKKTFNPVVISLLIIYIIWLIIYAVHRTYVRRKYANINSYFQEASDLQDEAYKESLYPTNRYYRRHLVSDMTDEAHINKIAGYESELNKVGIKAFNHDLLEDKLHIELFLTIVGSAFLIIYYVVMFSFIKEAWENVIATTSFVVGGCMVVATILDYFCEEKVYIRASIEYEKYLKQ